MKFFVSPLSETFGKIPDAKEMGFNVTTIEFTKDRPLTTIRGKSSYSGIKYVAFQVLDKNCVNEAKKELEEEKKDQKEIDTARDLVLKEKDPKTSENLKTTLIVCFVMLFAMAGAIGFICFFTNKQLLARIDRPFITPS